MEDCKAALGAHVKTAARLVDISALLVIATKTGKRRPAKITTSGAFLLASD
jgi:hypothetical protein